MPLGHLGLNVPDLAAAQQYYGRLLPALDYEAFPLHPSPSGEFDQFAFRPAGGRVGTYLFFYPSSTPGPPTPSGARGGHDGGSTAPGLQHLAFIVRTRSEVRAARDLAAELGSPIVHEPRVFPEYPQPYYATFWLDPFGTMLEAVCHHDRD